MRHLRVFGPPRLRADGAWKPARLENGLEIMVPLHIAPGEVIRVDTHQRKYPPGEWPKEYCTVRHEIDAARIDDFVVAGQEASFKLDDRNLCRAVQIRSLR